MTSLPEGYVDPTQPDAVAAVIRSVVDSAGLTAVTDLLGRMPGVRLVPGVTKGFLRPAVPPQIWLGSEYCWSGTEPPTLLHVVGGVILHRDEVEPGEAPDLLGRLLPDLVRRTGGVADASAALTAARDLSGG